MINQSDISPDSAYMISWSRARDTNIHVAVGIHIASFAFYDRSPEMVWNNPTSEEFAMVKLYASDFYADTVALSWGCYSV